MEFGGTRALLCVIKDLTQQKQMEEEILRVRKLESINLLAGGIAHDFNMMINAKKAMADGGIVELVAENKPLDSADNIPLRSGRYVLIAIGDRGTGIPQEHLSNIFDPYFTTKTTGNGLGLGLATSHSIIRKHGGHIMVESQPDAGTIFKIYLPASKRELPKAADAKPVPVAGRGKVLIRDDEEMIRDMAGDMLSHLEYEVHLAKDGPEAIAAIKQATLCGKPFEAVIMDLTIPGGCGGKEVIKEVRKIDQKVKAIVSSGYSNDPIMVDFAQHGFDGVVTKPYGIEKLSEVIRKVISSQAHGSSRDIAVGS